MREKALSAVRSGEITILPEKFEKVKIDAYIYIYIFKNIAAMVLLA